MPDGRGPLPQAQGVPLGAATVGPLIQPEKWLRPPHLLQRLRSMVAEASFSRLHFADPSLILLCDVSPDSLTTQPRACLGENSGSGCPGLLGLRGSLFACPLYPQPPPISGLQS